MYSKRVLSFDLGLGCRMRLAVDHFQTNFTEIQPLVKPLDIYLEQMRLQAKFL
jgi:hypothetical protein